MKKTVLLILLLVAVAAIISFSAVTAKETPKPTPTPSDFLVLASGTHNMTAPWNASVICTNWNLDSEEPSFVEFIILNMTDSGFSGLAGNGGQLYRMNYLGIQYEGTQSEPISILVAKNSTRVLCTATLIDADKEISYLPGDFTSIPFPYAAAGIAYENLF